MPTAAPLAIPSPMLPGGPLNPIDWIDLGSPGSIDGVNQTSIMRGSPGVRYWQRRRIVGDGIVPQGAPYYLQSRPYSRGAGAYSPKLGILTSNPIGAGVYAPFRLPSIAGPGARYAYGAIFFDVQTVPTSIFAAPTIPQESVNALIAQSHVAAMYATTG